MYAQRALTLSVHPDFRNSFVVQQGLWGTTLQVTVSYIKMKS